jgi:hypothetical protein
MHDQFLINVKTAVFRPLRERLPGLSSTKLSTAFVDNLLSNRGRCMPGVPLRLMASPVGQALVDNRPSPYNSRPSFDLAGKLRP